MKANAKILLSIMRDLNRQNIPLDHEVFDVICDNLDIDSQDLAEVQILLEADLLEKVAMKPEFEEVKNFIRRKGYSD